MKKQRKDIPKWLWAIAIVLVVLMVIGSIITSDFAYILPALLSLVCADKCSKWAKEINSNIILAFLIGFFFILLGLLFYYIYYRIKRKK